MEILKISSDPINRIIFLTTNGIEKRLPELISYACSYNAYYEFNSETSTLYVEVYSNWALKSLTKEYNNYFFGN